MSRLPVRQVASLSVLFFLIALPLAAADDPAAYFEANCAACHTIGTGKPPLDLAGLAGHTDREWLAHFIVDPEGVIASGDVYAKELVTSADGMIMPKPEGMTPELAKALIAWIEGNRPAEPASSRAANDDRPFTADDVARGTELFTGARALAGAGPACASCHTLNGRGAGAGGSLGPDLTLVHARLRGRAGLSAWLATPPTPVMRGLYRTAALTADENRALVALFEDVANGQPAPSWPYPARLLLLAATVALVLLLLMAVVWRDRLRGVRAPLVDGARLHAPPSSRTPLGTCGDRR